MYICVLLYTVCQYRHYRHVQLRRQLSLTNNMKNRSRVSPVWLHNSRRSTLQLFARCQRQLASQCFNEILDSVCWLASCVGQLDSVTVVPCLYNDMCLPKHILPGCPAGHQEWRQAQLHAHVKNSAVPSHIFQNYV
jgi:hypothetical protein